MKRTIAQVALLYHTLGWILIRLIGKIPVRGCRLRNFFAKQSQFRREVETLFPSTFGGNIGIITGKFSNLIVIDVDDLADTDWAIQHFGETSYKVLTGKGLHLYYRHPGGDYRVPCGTQLWGRHIDIRGDGGYVVAPDSIHPEFKQAYKWITPLEQLSLADMPVFNPALLPRPKVSITSPKIEFPRNRKNRLERARRYLSKIRCVSGNAAHNTLFRTCCKLIELFELTENEMRQILGEWNQTNCFDQNQQPYPWSEKELDHKITDSFRIVNFSKTKGTKSC